MSNRFSDADLERILSSPGATDARELALEVQRLYRFSFEERVKRGERLLGYLLSDVDRYHDHKETMAHAALLVMIALSAAVLSLPVWPPSWVQPIHIQLSKGGTAFLGFFLMWWLIHIYIRWQLRNRRWAAITQAGALRATGQWIQRDPKVEDLETYKSPPRTHQHIGNWIAAALDKYFIPFPRATLHEDVGKENYPAWIGEAVREQEKKGTGALSSEWLVTIGSFLLLVIVLIRTLHS